MNSYEKIATLLLDNYLKHRYNYVSTVHSGVSSAVFWNNSQKLKSEGFDVDSVRSLGYRIDRLPKQMTPILLSYLAKKYDYIEDSVFLQSVDSTNSYAKTLTKPSIIYTQKQTAGRGRVGRTFLSETGKTLCFSLLIKPDIPIEKASFYTTRVAVAMAEALRELSALDIKIKWPNDLLFQNKKIAGILCESATEGEILTHIIIGVGVNLEKREFEPEIAQTADSITNHSTKDFSEFDLLNLFLERFEKLCYDSVVLDRARYLSAVLGKKITVREFGGNEFDAIALDINEKGELLIQTAGGERAVGSGEVSLRFEE